MSRLALIVSLVAAAAAAQDAAGPLVRNAWYWQARARSDKAEDAWKQVRGVAPDNAEALAALGGFAARSGRADEAKALLARLQKAHPHDPHVPVLEREVELGTRYGPLLAEARKLVHEGRVAEGAEKYRALFGPAGPPGDLALEYYQTLSGVPGAFDEAREGLTQLTRAAPDQPRFRLELGKLLTYRAATRDRGIALLTSLERDRTAGGEASAALRQALLWLPPDAAAVKPLTAWLKSHPDDREIAQRLQRVRDQGALQEGFSQFEHGNTAQAERVFRAHKDNPDAQRGLSLVRRRRVDQLKQNGFAALSRGDLRGAEALFASAGDDPDARLGLALVAQRQATEAQRHGDLRQARVLLERAQKLAPQRRDLWQEPLRSVRFWSLMQEAKDSPDAEARLLEAQSLAPPADRWHATLELGNLLLKRGDAQGATVRFREVLADAPDQPDALRALAGALVQQARFDDAAAVNERLVRVAPRLALDAGWLRAESLRAQAATRPAEALALLRAARVAAPGDVWVLHDLGARLLAGGAVAEAANVTNDLLRLAPQLTEAHLLQARVLLAGGQPELALDALRDLPPSDDVIALRRELEVEAQLPGLVARRDAAGLALLESAVGNSPALLARIALGWSRIGDTPRAVQVMRTAMRLAPESTRGARLQLASALLQSGDETQLAALLRELQAERGLSPQERKALADLRIAAGVRSADAAREAGRDGAADAALAPLLREFPDEPRLLAAEARLLEQSDPARSHALYVRVLRANPDDLSASRGAVDTASDLDEAEALADDAASRHPADAQAAALQGEVQLRKGNDGSAMAALERARDLAAPSIVRGTPAVVPAVSTSATAAGADRLAASADDPRLRERVDRDIETIRARHRPAFEGGGTYRHRSGETGLSALQELRETARVERPLGYAAVASFRATAVELDAGTPGAYTAPRFGNGGQGGQQREIGAELQAQVRTRHFMAELGTTPIGFPVFAVTGGARLDVDAGPVGVALSAGRHVVTDSLLSYAGASDPVTRRHWGGVVSDGARLDLSLRQGPFQVFGYGEGNQVTGLNVADNVRLAGGGGATVALVSGEYGELRAGGSAATLWFQKNLSGFTFGQGGYFSPQRFFHAGVSLAYRKEGPLQIELVAEPGYDRQESAVQPAFPLKPGSPLAPGSSSQGASFNGHAQVLLPLGERFSAGLMTGAQLAPEFQETQVAAFIRAVAP